MEYGAAAVNRAFGGSLLALVVTVLAGCGDGSSDLGDLESCGALRFPAGAELVEYDNRASFGDEVSVAVVEIPAGELAEFKTASHLGEFTPGVPESWKYYWREMENFPALGSGEKRTSR